MLVRGFLVDLLKMLSLGKLKQSQSGDAGLRISDSVLGLMSCF